MKYFFSISFILIFANLLFGQLEYYYPRSKSDHIIKHTYYTLSYSEKYEQPYWVIYITTKQNIENGKSERKNNFRPDPLVKTGSSESSDYLKSGYDRGHLLPAGDMKFSDLAMSETFFYSNISPQHPSFNRGIWLRLEDLVRQWTNEFDSLYIVTAGVLVGIQETIGSNEVGVPKYFYKIILHQNQQHCYNSMCFLIPNKVGEKDLFDFVITIDSLENLTGIDFFYKLGAKVENTFESKINIDFWKNNYSTIKVSSDYPNKFDKINSQTVYNQNIDNSNQNKLVYNPKKNINNQSSLKPNSKSTTSNRTLIEKLNNVNLNEFTFLDTLTIINLEKNKPFNKFEDLLPIINDTIKYNQVINILKRSY
jgi:endonuclease G